MKLGLQGKILLLILALLAAFGAAFTAFTTRVQDELGRQRLRDLAQTFAAVLSGPVTDQMTGARSEDLRTILSPVSRRREVLYVYVVDESGTVLVDTSEGGLLEGTQPTDRLSVKASRSPGMLVQEAPGLMEITYPIARETNRLGSLRIGLSTASAEEEWQAVRDRNRVFGAAFVMFLLVAAYVLIRHLLRHLTPLLRGAEAISNGHFYKDIHVNSKDELATLAGHFNQARKRLQKSWEYSVSLDYLDSILRSMHDALIVVSPKRTILTVNAANCALLGYEEWELIGQPVEKIFAEATGFDEFIQLIESGFIIKNVEQAYLPKKGNKIPVSF